MYTWGYIKDCALAKLDLNKYEEYDEQVTTVVSRFPFYANEAMTQICSAVKPNYTFAHFVITSDLVGKTQTMPLAIFFKVQSMDYKGAMLWVWTIVLISVGMILILNKWSDKQQKIIGKRG